MQSGGRPAAFGIGTETRIVWIRRELRVQDHLALWSATRDASSVIPLYIIDGAFHSASAAKRSMIIRSLRSMRENLKRIGGNLFIRRGEPREVLLRLSRETGAAGVHLTRSYEPGVEAADRLLRSGLEEEGRIFRDFKDDVIFEKTELLNSSGEPFRVYGAYRRAWLAAREVIPPPLPTLHEMNSPEIEPGEIPEPDAEELSPEMQTHGAGEGAGLAALDDFLRNRAGSYAKNRNVMAANGTSRLSHHLALGSLGVRRMYREIVRLKGSKAAPAEGSGAFLDQIIWREFYKQILANFPHVVGKSFREKFDAIPWKTNVGLFNAWRDGVTGYPVVDAAMRQLRREGWMHNRGRMITAGFLTKDLHVDWRMGERHFMEWLADGDLALNNGGWQWSAGTGTDAQPWHRIFNPVLQGRKFDPDGEYVKKYLPELVRVPSRYIHSPWEMPESVAADAGVRIGRDYPAPVVDHPTERRKALEWNTPGGKRRGTAAHGGLFNHEKYSNIR